jgi:CheY-like chemotaxis protein
MLRRLIGEDIAIELHLAPDLSMVEADEGRIEQIITNLVVNARDAMPQGGTVTILSENVAAEGLPADMPAPETGFAVRIAVSDTGIGMDDHVLARCFEPFFTTKEAGKGTGMGLAVVYGILQQHRGGAAITSRPGQGTTISCYLPAIAALPGEAAASPQETLPRERDGGNIMLVEDDTGVRAFTARVLEARNFVVFAAGSPAEAMALFDRVGPQLDLVISDVVLPGGGGLRLIEELRARRADLRVLVSSGYLDDRSRREDLMARGVPYLAKPYTIGELLAAVDAALAEAPQLP